MLTSQHERGWRGVERQVADYIEITPAIEMLGLRLVLIPGLPGP
jgi:hypothetical protein